ncbi:MAG: hypothetical protein ACI30A_04425 [Paludibacteraceae bacterium]
MTTKAKVWTSLSVIVVLALAAFIYVKFFFVYSSGTNEGDINYFQKEGFVFKTYEGKMIQTGYNSKNASATIQSNEFKFSVDNERVAQRIDDCSNQQVKLHWKRYFWVRCHGAVTANSLWIALFPLRRVVFKEMSCLNRRESDNGNVNRRQSC